MVDDHPISVTSAIALPLTEDGDGTRSLVLRTCGDREVGVWEIDPGVTTDVEVDEVFVVLSSSATISVEGRGDVHVAPGDVVHMADRTATTWTVHERLRKVYLVEADGG